MAPQHLSFNRKIWKNLEAAVRKLNGKENIFGTYVISGPTFDFNKKVEVIGSKDNNNVTLPIPHAFFKSILTENNKGSLHIWSFVIPHKPSRKPLKDFLVPAKTVKIFSGLNL
jgi:endonuclease G